MSGRLTLNPAAPAARHLSAFNSSVFLREELFSDFHSEVAAGH